MDSVNRRSDTNNSLHTSHGDREHAKLAHDKAEDISTPRAQDVIEQLLLPDMPKSGVAVAAAAPLNTLREQRLQSATQAMTPSGTPARR